MRPMRSIIGNLRDEAETTIRMLFALKAFRQAISSQVDVDLINRNPDFWRIYESSVRTNLFIGIRRLYEGRDGTFNFQKFIEQCEENIDAFSKEELRKRKATLHNSKDWIDEYMLSVYEPNTSDFRDLAKIVRMKSRRMKGIYTEAASKVYAHAVHMDHAEIAKITNQLRFDEMEEALDSIWHCYEQVWQMFENGRKPDFEVGDYPYKDEVYECFRKQLQ